MKPPKMSSSTIFVIAVSLPVSSFTFASTFSSNSLVNGTAVVTSAI